jgi:hypothetical protein
VDLVCEKDEKLAANTIARMMKTIFFMLTGLVSEGKFTFYLSEIIHQDSFAPGFDLTLSPDSPGILTTWHCGE